MTYKTFSMESNDHLYENTEFILAKRKEATSSDGKVSKTALINAKH